MFAFKFPSHIVFNSYRFKWNLSTVQAYYRVANIHVWPLATVRRAGQFTEGERTAAVKDACFILVGGYFNFGLTF